MNYFRKLVWLAEEKNRKASLGSSKIDSPEPDIKILGQSFDFAAALTFTKDKHFVPKLIRDCILYLNEHGLNHVGLYRVSGTSSKVKMLTIAYEDRILTGVDLSTFRIGVNEISSLLKHYLRSMTTPIIPPDIVGCLDQSIRLFESNGESIIKLFRYYLLILPHSTFATLGWLMRHLSLVSSHSSVNMMTLNNLIIIFSPCLNIQANILSKLIIFSDKIFHEDELSPSNSILELVKLRMSYLSEKDFEKYLNNELSTRNETFRLIKTFMSYKKYANIANLLTECIYECESSINLLKAKKFEQKIHTSTKPIENMSPTILYESRDIKSSSPVEPKIEPLILKKCSSVDLSDFKIPDNRTYHLFTSKMRSKYGIIRHTFAPSFSNSFDALSTEKQRYRSNISNNRLIFDDVPAT